MNRPLPDPAYRLQVAVLNREVYKLADRAGVLGSARKYRPEWTLQDVEQELIAYLLHLTKNTKSGWDPKRGAFSTWVTLAATGWVCKLGRRKGDPASPGCADDDDADDWTDTAGTPEDQLEAKQTAQEALRGRPQ